MDKNTILIVDDEASQRELLAGYLAPKGYEILEVDSGEAACETLEERTPDMVLLDVRLPGMDGVEVLRHIRERFPRLPVLLITAHADLRQAVAALKSGADDYLAKPIDLAELLVAIEDALGHATPDPSADDATLPSLPAGIVAESLSMRALLQTVAVVARSEAPVLITGENGTGKEVIARLIHQWSARHSAPLVATNCGGLAESIIESELFGHMVGAFTGATQAREGLFRAASSGTLFLDEIGELPLHLQPKLLRVLDGGQIQPVGSDHVLTVDTRVIAATNRDLEAEVKAHRFREDLYFRINVIELRLPPLRERREDILPLAKQFAGEFAVAPVRLSPQATSCLLAHSWPGNVRELRNAIQRACLLCRGDIVMPEHLPPRLARLPDVAEEANDGHRLQQVERALIAATLEECGGNRTAAAKKLGMSRRTLLYKLRAQET